MKNQVGSLSQCFKVCNSLTSQKKCYNSEGLTLISPAVIIIASDLPGLTILHLI